MSCSVDGLKQNSLVNAAPHRLLVKQQLAYVSYILQHVLGTWSCYQVYIVMCRGDYRWGLGLVIEFTDTLYTKFTKT
jgi:hypothetical protein